MIQNLPTQYYNIIKHNCPFFNFIKWNNLNVFIQQVCQNL